MVRIGRAPKVDAYALAGYPLFKNADRRIHTAVLLCATFALVSGLRVTLSRLIFGRRITSLPVRDTVASGRRFGSNPLFDRTAAGRDGKARSPTHRASPDGHNLTRNRKASIVMAPIAFWGAPAPATYAYGGSDSADTSRQTQLLTRMILEGGRGGAEPGVAHCHLEAEWPRPLGCRQWPSR